MVFCFIFRLKKERATAFINPLKVKTAKLRTYQGGVVKPETLFKLDKGNLCKKKGLFPAADKSSVKSVREGNVSWSVYAPEANRFNSFLRMLENAISSEKKRTHTHKKIATRACLKNYRKIHENTWN